MNYLMVYEQQIVDQSKAICRSSLTCFKVLLQPRDGRRKRIFIEWFLITIVRWTDWLIFRVIGFIFRASNFFWPCATRSSKNSHLFESNFSYFLSKSSWKKSHLHVPVYWSRRGSKGKNLKRANLSISRSEISGYITSGQATMSDSYSHMLS